MKPFVILTLTDTTYKWAGSNDSIQFDRSNFNVNLLARDCYTCHFLHKFYTTKSKYQFSNINLQYWIKQQTYNVFKQTGKWSFSRCLDIYFQEGERTPGKLIFRVSCECVLLLQLCANYTTWFFFVKFAQWLYCVAAIYNCQAQWECSGPACPGVRKSENHSNK